MRKTNLVVFVFASLALSWMASTPSSFAAEASKSDAGTDGVVSNDAQPPARKFGSERDLVFKEAPQHEREARYDPTHYEAEFELVFRYPDYSEVSVPVETTNTRGASKLPMELGAIVNQVEPRQFDPYATARPKKVEYWLRTLAGRIDDKLRPSNDMVDNLCATSSFKARGTSTHTEKVLVLRVKVRDDEKEALEQKIRTLTLLIDEGLSPKYHEDYLAAVKLVEQHLDELRNAAAEKEEQLAKIKEDLEELASVKDLPEGALSSLIAHKHLLSVKRAGVQARLEACQKILAMAQNDQVRSARINADIELAGIEAEEKKVDEIIAARMKRTELETDIKRDWSSVQRKRQEIGDTEELLEQHRRAVAEKWAYPEMGEILVNIAPGKVEPNSTEQSGGRPWWMK